jgi:asparagine synthase (glutamine-hydrolysing)
MWAFAIYDRKEKSIFLSRDRFGIKPLYYWYSPEGNFYFASEIKQFTVLPGWKAVLNKTRALDYLYHAQTDHTEESLFKGVYSIPPSHYVFLDVEKVKENVFKLEPVKWYNVNIIKSKQTFEEAKNEFLNKFKDSVELHLRADVPIGSALSGGLDSSSIVSYINILLKKENKTDLQKTFSSCSEDPRYDERSWMEEVVKETLVDGHYVYPKGEDVFKLTEKLIWFMDEPYQSQSAFLGYHVFMEAKKNNVVVLLNGQGADEYLSGYGAYKSIRQNNMINKFNGPYIKNIPVINTIIINS